MMRSPRRLVVVVVLTLAAFGAAACSGSSTRHSTTVSTNPAPASTTSPAATAGSSVSTTAAPVSTSAPTKRPATSTVVPASTTTNAPIADRPLRAGAQRLHFELGPIDITPGQNNIDFSRRAIPQPTVDGYIVRIAPNLRLEDQTIPAVDVIHLHHGVWLNLSAPDATSPILRERFFAAGEEKTAMELPDGYGYSYHTTDKWLLNYMIHNLWPNETKVWITYDIDLIPADNAAAASIQPARPVWTDVQNGSAYPVFDVLKGSGTNGAYTYPDDAKQPYDGTPKNAWTVDHDGVLVATAGHLHPGGLHNDLWLRRAGAVAPTGHAKQGAADTAHLFSSIANYWEPAGAVSWDVAMTATPTTWRVAVHTGDVLSTTATYDSARASWYESMGIMVVWMADKPAAAESTAADPFAVAVDVAGELTHGHLAENDHHGGAVDTRYHDLTQAPSIAATPTIGIGDFSYAQGDLLVASNVPTIAPGAAITFDNADAPLGNGEWHTITACKAPCTSSTGIAFPLADGDTVFDSGQLGTGGPPTADRTTWTTPTDLQPGTYTYFCRIHPFMRGAFRVSTSAAAAEALT